MTTYTPITKNGVEQAEPLDFADAPPPAYAKLEIETVVQVEGFTLRVLFRDTSLADAVAALRRRGCVPASTACERAAATPPGAIEHADILPTCPKHNKVMRTSQYGGYFCTAADPDAPNGKCTHKVK